MNRTLNMYSIFYYNIINIRVLFIIRVLIILKYFGDLDFECYIYMCVCVCVCVCVEKEGQFKKKNGDLSYIYGIPCENPHGAELGEASCGS